jgi:hypothetical protein
VTTVITDDGAGDRGRSAPSDRILRAQACSTASIAQQCQIVAFDLGDCDGTLMYRSVVVWFFPSNGETFESKRECDLQRCRQDPYGN